MGPPKATEVLWDPAFRSYDFGPNHPFQERTRELAVHLMDLVGAFRNPELSRLVPSVAPASRSELARFHRKAYLDLVERRSAAERAPPLDSGDTPSFPGCYEAAARICGGALRSFRSLEEGGVRRVFHPAGGLHHAHPESASGFCIFNDLAVAISEHVGPGRTFGRVAYVDIDAHHGDGVMYGFYEDGRVLDIDFHQDGRTLFPGTGLIEETGAGDGTGLKVNLPLPPGASDDVLVPAFRRVVPTMLRAFRPDLLVVQHGVDGHTGDRLAGLRYGPMGYATVLGELLALSDELCGGRILVAGGGGYTPSNVARVLAQAGLAVLGGERAKGPLPEAWRTEFAAGTGEPPPADWVDPEFLGRPIGESPVVGFLVDELSERLGVRFPSST